MDGQLNELIEFLDNPRRDLTVHDAVRSLVNLSTKTSTLKYLQSEDIIKMVLSKITNPKCVTADLFCMLLSNMTKDEAIVSSLVKLEIPKNPNLCPSESALDQLTDVFIKGIDKGYNKDANFHFLSSVFADISMVPMGRVYFLSNSKTDGKAPLTKLIVFSEHPDTIRRGGVATAMKNVCFEKDRHLEILSEDSVNILPYLLLPLCGPEEYDIEKREVDPTIRRTLVEAILLLTTTLKGREYLRERKVYPILRETHKVEEDGETIDVIDRAVQVLMRDESKETLKEGEEEQPVAQKPKKVKVTEEEAMFEEV
ncbi:Protein hgh1 [Mycoemilia scoparia]|uniref:Protein hgh1 n=1 Tax=Mycoemilia scoparia TaxID=417184 RepID=A0A9W8A662_9FUNG|nr:Protein hgh1 [Mycoemilia scoparia]